MIAVNSVLSSFVIKKFVLVVPEQNVMRSVRGDSLALVADSTIVKLDKKFSVLNEVSTYCELLKDMIAEDEDGSTEFVYIECVLPEPSPLIINLDKNAFNQNSDVETFLSYVENLKPVIENMGFADFTSNFMADWQFVITDAVQTTEFVLTEPEGVKPYKPFLNSETEQDDEDWSESESDEPEEVTDEDLAEESDGYTKHEVQSEQKSSSSGRISLEDMLPKTKEPVQTEKRSAEQFTLFTVDHLSRMAEFYTKVLNFGFTPKVDFNTLLTDHRNMFISLIPDYLAYRHDPDNCNLPTEIDSRIEAGEELEIDLNGISVNEVVEVYINCLFRPFTRELDVTENYKKSEWLNALNSSLTDLTKLCEGMFSAPNASVRVSRTGLTTNTKQLSDLLATVSCLSTQSESIDYRIVEEFMQLTYNMSNTLVDPVCNILALLHNTELTCKRNWTKRSKAASTLFLMNFFKGFLTAETSFDTNSAYTALITIKALYSRDGRLDENAANEILVYSGNVLPDMFDKLGLQEIYMQTVGAKQFDDLSEKFTSSIEELNSIPSNWTVVTRSRNLSNLLNLLDEFCSVVDNDAISFSVASLSAEILYRKTNTVNSNRSRNQKSIVGLLRQLLVALNTSGDLEQEVGNTRITVFDAVFEIISTYSDSISKQRVMQAPNKNVSLLNQIGSFLGVQLN